MVRERFASLQRVFRKQVCGIGLLAVPKACNEGEKTVGGYASNGNLLDVSWQIVDVTNRLGLF